MVGMSGGVDSSVAALLLKQKGFSVEGLFMKNWEEDDTATYCSAQQDIHDARLICDQLDIPLHIVNFSKTYWDKVFTHFLSEHLAGNTPNPDILCNKEIKFKAFLDHSLGLGSDYIATGHYAINALADGGYELRKGVDANKDQSYFLYTLSQQALSKSLFPIGALPKEQVRALAASAHFKNCNKKDSTGICFIGERRFAAFLNQYLPHQPGDIVTESRQKIGRHLGLMFYTLGQRKGLGIGGKRGSEDKPWYVVKKDRENNELIVVQGESPLLYRKELDAQQLHWIAGEPPTPSFRCSAKIRYRQKDQPCVVQLLSDNRCHVCFDQPQRAVTPGQAIVFYREDVCLGGGTILYENCTS